MNKVKILKECKHIKDVGVSIKAVNEKGENIVRNVLTCRKCFKKLLDSGVILATNEDKHRWIHKIGDCENMNNKLKKQNI